MNWSEASNWLVPNGNEWVTATTYPGQVAGTGDVTIQNGHTVILDVSPAQPITRLFVGEGTSGVLQYEAITPRTLTVNGIVRINPGGTFRSALTGTVTTHQLEVGESIVNEGTLDFSTTAGDLGTTLNAAGAGITFTENSNFSGLFDLSTATRTNLRASNGVILNKGNILSFIPGGIFQVQSANTLGFLTIQSGTFNLMGANSFSNPIFHASTGSYNIPSTGGFQLDNPNATVTAMFGTLINNGSLIIKRGVFNLGNGRGNEILTTGTGRFEMSGGTMNISGRFRNDGGVCEITGGTLNLATSGHADSSLAIFYMSDASALTISGNSLITFAHPNFNTIHFNDIEIVAGQGNKTITGGTFQMGSSAITDRPFFVNSNIPIHNLVVLNRNIEVLLTGNLTINNRLTLNGHLLLNNYNLTLGPETIGGTHGANAGMIVSGLGTGEVHKRINQSGSYIFPFGNGSAYLPVTLNFTGGDFAQEASVSVRMVDGKQPQNTNTTNYLTRYWMVRTSGITSPVYNFTGTYGSIATDVVGDEGWVTTGVYTTAWRRLRESNSGFTIYAAGLTGDADITGINSQAAAPEVSVTASPAAVCSGSTVQLTATATGDGTLTYSWTPVTGLSDPTISNPEATVPTVTTSTPITYTVTVTDGMGGSATRSASVTVNPQSSITSLSGETSLCRGTTGTFTTNGVVLGGGTGAWSSSNTTVATVSSLGVVTAMAAGNTIIRYTITGGCNGVVYAEQSITVNDVIIPSVSISASPGSNICTGTLVTFTASATNGGDAPLFQWRVNGINVGPATSNNTYTNSSLTNGQVVSVELTSNALCATERVRNNITMGVTPIPSAPTVRSNTPVCTNGTINLTASTIAGATYSWTGPNGFTSSLQNPTRANVTDAMAGTYSVIATVNGCSSLAASTLVSVNPPLATPTANVNGAVCEGQTLLLTTPTVTGASYLWTGPNSFQSTDQNPSIANVSLAAGGSYRITVSMDGCISEAGVVEVIVNPRPAAPTASNSGPACAGGTISLSTPEVTGATYSWAGPNEFTSSERAPIRTNVTASMAGIYQVTVTEADCPSAPGSTSVIVNPIPSAPVASSNIPCVDGTLQLSATTISGATYSWTGPNSFISNVQNPTIANVTASMAGSYSVTVTVAGCESPAGTTNVVVNSIPSTPSVDSNSPVCSGTSLNLTTAAVAGATYAWTGPNSFTSTDQNPTRTGATAAMAGTYTLTVTVGGCTSLAGTTTVVVNPIPATPTANSNSPVCAGSTITLTTSAVAGATYAWTGPNNFTSTLQNPTIANATTAMAGTYRVTVTVAGCTSQAGSTSVSITPTVTPTVSLNVSSQVICSGTSVTFTATPTNGGGSPSYQWFRNGAVVPGVTGSTFTSSTLTNGSTIRVVLTSNASCASPATATSNEIVMSVYTGAPTTSTGNNADSKPSSPQSTSICPPASNLVYNIPVNMTANAALYTWEVPPGFNIIAGQGTRQITVSVPGPGSTVGSHDIRVRATNPCGSSPWSSSLTVNIGTFAAVNAGPNFSMCLGNTTTLTNTLSGNATSVTWAVISGNGTISGGPYPTTYQFTPTAAGTVTLRATTNTPTGSGCPNVPGTAQITVTVNDPSVAPTVLNVSQTAICSGSPVTLTQTGGSLGTGATWRWYSNNTYTNLIGTSTSVDASITVNPSTTTTYYLRAESTTGAPCAAHVPGPSAGVTVTVSQPTVAPTTLNGSPNPVCSGSSVTLTQSGGTLGTGASWRWYSDPTYTTFVGDGAGVNASLSVNPTSNTTYYLRAEGGTAPCSGIVTGPAAGVSITVNDPSVVPTALNVSQPAICNGTPVTLTQTGGSLGTGASWHWYSNDTYTTLVGTSTSADASINVNPSTTTTYYLRAESTTGAPCPSNVEGPIAGVTVSVSTVSVAPTTLNISVSPICSGSSVTLTQIGGTLGSGASWRWYSDADYTTFIGNGTGANASLSVSPTTNTTYYLRAEGGTAPCTETVAGPAAGVSVEVNQPSVAPTALNSLETAICNGSSVTLTQTGGNLGTEASWHWYSNSTYTNLVGTSTSADASFTVSPTTTTTYYLRAQGGATPCAAAVTGPAAGIRITVNQPVVITTQPNPSQSICAGFPVSLSVTATGTDLTYAWYKGGNPLGITTPTLMINQASLTDSGIYTVEITGATGCSSVTSSEATITVSQDIEITTQPVPVTTCEGSTVQFTVAATGNITSYVWRKGNTPLFDGGTISGAGTATLTLTNVIPADGGSYNVVISSPGGACEQTISNPALLTVNPLTVGGTVGGGTTVCSGTNTTFLTLSGHTGNVIRWESSLDNFTTAGTPISTATTSLTVSNLTARTTYRAVVQSGNCTPANSASTTVNVDPVSAGGTVGGATTVCSSTNTTILNLTGHTGNVIRWESSLDNFATAGTPISNTTTSLTASNLTTTTSYRAVVQSGSCTSANSSPATVTVSPVSVGGTVGGATTVCSGTNNTILNLTGHTGNVIRWESSLDNFATAGTTISNTTATLTISNLTASTSYRAVVQSGSCAFANSTTATVTVSPVSVGGTIDGAATVCSGTNSTILNMTGHTGNVIRWESSLDNFATAGTPISNTTTSLTASNLTTTTSYRAVVQSGSCTPANSASATVTVSPVSVGGTVGGATTVCSGTNTTILNLTGHTGNVIRWESSLDNFATAGTPISNTTTTLTASNLMASTSYRAVVQSGSCTPANSASATVTVSPVSVGGTVGGATTVCSGTNTTILNLTGHTGNVIRWESSLDNFATAGTTISNTTATLTISNLTATTSYRAVVQSGSCASANSSPTSVTVSPVSAGGSVSPVTPVVCAGSNSGTLTLSGYVGSIERWESSTNGGYSWAPIGNTSTTQSYSNLTQSTLYRAVIRSGSCPEAYSQFANVVVVTPYTPTITTNPTPPIICFGQSAFLTASSGPLDGPFIGTFDNANPTGWSVNGSNNNFPSAPSNEASGPWGRATNDRTYYNVNYRSAGGFFSVVNGPITSSLETPVFSLVGMTSAFFNTIQAIRLANGASARIEISTDGGNTYNTTLAQYTGPASVGDNNGLSNVYFNLAQFLGQTSLRVRYTFTGTVNSTWAIDNTIISATPGGNPYANMVTYSWSPSATLSSASGLTVTATPIETTTYTVNATIVADGITCEIGTARVTVTVNNLPTITLGANPAVCRGTTSAALTYSATTGSPNQYSINYDASANTAGLIDVTNAALQGGQITLTVPATAAAGTYNGTLTVRNTTTGCVSAIYPISVTINALPTITLGASPAVCFGTITANLPYSAITGTPDQYSITYNVAAITAGFVNVTNAPLTASPIVLTVPATAAPATYNGTLTVTNSVTGCVSLEYPISVTINPTPAIAPMTATICSGDAFSVTPVNGTNGIVPTGTTYSWSAPTGTGFTGGMAGTGVSVISGTLFNPTQAAVTATYMVTPTSGSCSGNPFTVTVTINYLPITSNIYHN